MTKTKLTGTGSRGRFSKSDWLRVALDMLADGGIEAVRVERLAKKLGVAKSGFYYHFKDREDLHVSLLEYWVNLDSGPMDRSRDAATQSVQDRLLLVAESIEQANLVRYDMAIRLWARQSDEVGQVWRQEMDRRSAFLRGVFAELGFEGDTLEARTRLFVAHQVLGSEIFGDLSLAERRRIREEQIAILTAGH